MKKIKKVFKSYEIEHKANQGKVDTLFNLYDIYKKEFKIKTTENWNLFLHNQINPALFNSVIKFSMIKLSKEKL
jgi:hypothetical protein